MALIDLLVAYARLIAGMPLMVFLFFLRLKELIFGKPLKSLEGKLVVITGGGSGIGQKMAVEVAKLKAIPIILDINLEGMRKTIELVNNNGGSGMMFKCDVTDADEVMKVAEEVSDSYRDKHVEILINNAGIVSDNKSIESKSKTKVELVFKVNVLSHFHTIKAFLPQMIANGSGHIVNIASIAGVLGTSAYMTDYVSSKFAAVGLHESLKAELYVRNLKDIIKATLICPYYINTGMFSGVKRNHIEAIIPMLDPQFVTEKIIRGIRREELEVYIPNMLHLFFWMNRILPSTAFLELGRICGTLDTMTTFLGRQ